MKLKPYTKGLLLTAAGAVGWGISGVCSQSLFANYTLSSDWLTAVRMLLSGILLLLLNLPKEKGGIFNVWKSKADIGCLEPIAATVLSYLFLNTRFGAVELIGFAAVLTTVVLSMGKEN